MIEILKLIVQFLTVVIWPLTVVLLVVYLNHRAGDSIKEFIANVSGKRNIKAKLGGAEFELNIVEKLQKNIKDIANEPDPQKRLEMAKHALSVDDAIRELDENDIKYLKRYKSEANAFVTDVYGTGMSEEEMNSYTKLAKLRLIHGWPAQGGESFDYISSVGEAVLQRLGENDS